MADKRKLENYGGISLLNRSYKLYSKKFKLKIEKNRQQISFGTSEWIPKRQILHQPLFRMKLLIENRTDFNLETSLAFPVYVKTFDNVKKGQIV